MLPLLVGAAALGAWHWHKKHARPQLLTPPRAALHGDLMQNQIDPVKLDKAAALFGAEGLTNEARQLSAKAKEVRKQAAGARELIDRARTGDQNAMGIIAACRENALQGNPRAIVSCKLMLKYCELYPMQALGPLGELPSEDPGVAFHEAIRAGHITSPFGVAA